MQLGGPGRGHEPWLTPRRDGPLGSAASRAELAAGVSH